MNLYSVIAIAIFISLIAMVGVLGTICKILS